MKMKEPHSTFFNFRLRPTELKKIQMTAINLGYLSFAEFIRAAIREKIKRDLKNAN